MIYDVLDNVLKTFILQKNKDSNASPASDSNAFPNSDSPRGIGTFVDKFAKNLVTNKIGTNIFGPQGMFASTVLDGLGSLVGNFKGFKETPIDQFNLSNFAGYTGGGGMADRQDKFGYNIVSVFGDYNKFAREQAAKEQAAGFKGYSGNYYTDIANRQDEFTSGSGNQRDYDSPTPTQTTSSSSYDPSSAGYGGLGPGGEFSGFDSSSSGDGGSYDGAASASDYASDPTSYSGSF